MKKQASSNSFARYVIGFGLWMSLCLCPLLVQAQQTLTFNHQGLERSYILYMPSNLPDNAPLVFVLHGYTSGANIIMNYCGMNAVARRHRFAVCYPQGTRAVTNETHWNANLSISSVDDIDFLTQLAAHLQATHKLSAEHTFSCGMSNGGFMSYTLACERPDVFKAIASVTGTMSGGDWGSCDPTEVIPVLQISGSADNVVPIDGSLTTAGDWGGAPGMAAVTEFWVNKNECMDKENEILAGNFPTRVTRYVDCIQENEVWEYLISGWGHNWPLSWSGTGFAASETIWEFFSKVIERTTVNTSDAERLPNRIQLMPNPVQDVLYIQSDDQKPHPYTLSTMNGRLLQTGNARQLDLSDLANGLYLLRIGEQVFKVMKTDK